MKHYTYKRIYTSCIHLGLFLLLFNKVSFAQLDNHLSQFTASPLSLNPAMTGMYEEKYKAYLHYRTQWKSIIRNPFINQNVAFDMNKNKFGYGGIIINNRAGQGSLQTLAIILSGAYEITTTDLAESYHLTTGLQLGVINKSVNVSGLTFDNQYSTANGGGFDPSINSQEVFTNTSYWVPEVNFGVYYYSNNSDHMFQPYVGLSGFHLTSPKESFLGQETRYPARYVSNIGSKIKLNELWAIDPSVLFMYQSGIGELNLGAMGSYFFTGTNATLLFGAFYRGKDAVILQTGVLYKDYSFRLSYDINVSTLRRYTGGRGGFEFSIMYTPKKGEYVPSIPGF